MNIKYKEAAFYRPEIAHACETALVRLLQAFTTHKQHLRLVGGLVPRYLTPEAPPDVPAHVGTTDVDVVLDIPVLVAGGKYASLRRQLKEAGFSRHRTSDGKASSWQWELPVNERVTVLVEFLQHADALPQAEGAAGPARLASIEDEDVSACLIPYVGIVKDWYEEKTVRVHLEDGLWDETIRYADAAAFIVLKALAFDQRVERKDAADLIHVMRYWRVHSDHEDQQDLIELLACRLGDGMHREALEAGMSALRRRFCTDRTTKGFEKLGPGAHAAFLGMRGEDAARERREASGLVEHVLRSVGQRLGRDLLGG